MSSMNSNWTDPAPLWLDADFVQGMQANRAHQLRISSSSSNNDAVAPRALLGAGETVSTALGELELAGKTVLVVFTGVPSRKRVINSLLGTGVSLVMYASDYNWCLEYVPRERWVIGHGEDAGAAVAAVRAWQAHQAAHGRPGRGRLNGLLCYDEYGVTLAAGMAETLGLPYMPLHVANDIRNKFAFRAACVAAGLPAPRYVRLTGPLTAEDKLRILDAGMR
jgi:hypothetical protein